MKLEKPKYRTWIRKKAIVLFALLTLFSIVGLSFAFISVWFLLLLIPTFIFGYILLIISISAYRFSAKGGDYQKKIHRLIVNSIKNMPSDNILDIGCGSGHLIMEIAKNIPESILTGIDFWGMNWEYSKKQTEKNAELEGISSRTHFFHGTASELNFKDNSFDNVVSCLTFHEVRDTKDKLICVKEAIRVLKPSGRFVLFDLFLSPEFYPPLDTIRKHIEQNGAQIIEIKKLSEYMNLPFPLNNKKVLGFGLMIVGEKT